MINVAHMSRGIGKAFLYLLLAVAALVMIFPLYTGLVTSLLGPDNLSTYPPKLFPVEFRLDN
ncbi:MAG TPA: hypothetical protein VLC52_01285, partial [Anaerolineae bacterium]|nr:hypothetical protein [Anaerolineae bacterium]